MEEWRDINENYSVSSYGNVKSKERTVVRLNGRTHHVKEKMLSQCIDSKGYLRCGVGKIHKLVAEAFVPNPNGYTIVHHKDHNQLNNKVENLEWIDETIHNRIHGGQNPCKKVYQYYGGVLVNVYDSTQDAARQNDRYNYSNIARCCRGEQETYKGYKWSYEPFNNF